METYEQSRLRQLQALARVATMHSNRAKTAQVYKSKPGKPSIRV